MSSCLQKPGAITLCHGMFHINLQDLRILGRSLPFHEQDNTQNLAPNLKKRGIMGNYPAHSVTALGVLNPALC